MRIFRSKISRPALVLTKQSSRNSRTETDFVSRNQNRNSESFDHCDLFWDKRGSEQSGGDVRQKDKEISHNNTNANSVAKTSEAVSDKEIYANSVANRFTKTEEGLAHSISQPSAGDKDKTKKGFPQAYAQPISNRHARGSAITESNRNSGSDCNT
jgi:hypothetical protein